MLKRIVELLGSEADELLQHRCETTLSLRPSACSAPYLADTRTVSHLS